MLGNQALSVLKSSIKADSRPIFYTYDGFNILARLSLFVTPAGRVFVPPFAAERHQHQLAVGPSAELTAIARALQTEADQWCEPTVWSQGAFEPGGTTIGELLDEAGRSDLAALVLTPDDSVVTRGDSIPVARDNVIFELGLFLGALGPRRVFIIRPRDQELRLPSDLAGVTVLTYRPNRRDGNLRAAIGPAATAIRERIAADGMRSDRDPSRPVKLTRVPWTGSIIEEPPQSTKIDGGPHRSR